MFASLYIYICSILKNDKKFTYDKDRHKPRAIRAARHRWAFVEESKKSTIDIQVTDKRKSTRVYRENPIDSASAHWNSEASVAGRKSRRCNEKALLLHRFLRRVSRDQKSVARISAIWRIEERIGEREREISTHFAIANFLMHYGYSN